MTHNEPDNSFPQKEMPQDSCPKGVVTNAAWNTFGTVFSIATSFITAPVLIHNLGASQYGIFLLMGSIVGLLGIMNFGLGEATLRYVAHYYGDRDAAGMNRVFGSTLSFYVVIAGAVSTVILGGAPVMVTWLNIPGDQFGQVTWLLRIAGLVFATGIISSAFLMVPLALQRYDIGSKITIGVNVARSSGYIVLAVAGFGLIHLLLWDLIFGLGALAVRVLVVRRLLPGLRLLPSFSFRGLREIIDYSIFSFLTWAVHTMHRESGKLLLGRFLGAAPVAYLGTPDSIAQRIHMVIASGSEALIPRFSAGRDWRAAERLFWGSTWSALSLSLILLIPFFVLVSDFLRLWISPEFARASGTAGQALALYLVAQGAFAPVAAYFRGIGKPWFVSLVIFGALVITVLSSLQLIPVYGVEGAAYAYLAGSAAPFLGVIVGGIYAFGRSSSGALLRAVGLPVVTGSLTCVLGVALRSRFGELSWVGLVAHGAAVLALGVVLVIGSDLFLGGQNSSAKQLLTRIASSRRVAGLLKRIPMKTFSAKPVAEV